MRKLLPTGWKIEPIRNLAHVLNGGTPSRYVASFWENGCIPWATPTDITRASGRYLWETSELITRLGLLSSGARLLPPNSLLMTSRATLGEVRIAEREVCTNQGFKNLVPFKNVNHEFLFYQLQLNKARYKSLGIGSTFLEVNKRDTEKFELLVAPEPEQPKVAKILSTVDVAIENAQALIVKLNRIKEGLMHDLFTRGVMPDGRLRPARAIAPALYSQSQVGWIPNEWVLAPVGTKVKVLDPNPSHRYPSEVSVGVPICSTENFIGEDDFDLERSKQMPEFVFSEQVTRCGFDPDDVVFARKGRIGLARRYGQERKTFSHTVVILKSKSPHVSQQWLLWFSRSRGFLGAIERAMNTNLGVPTLGIGTIQKIIRPFPLISEQRRISAALDQASNTIRAETEELKKLHRLKIGLMQDLLSGRVRVQVPDIAEDSA